MSKISDIIQKVKDAAYGINVKLSSKFSKKKSGAEVKQMNSKKRMDNLFYYSLLAVPLIMLVFTYIVINGNSILLAFKTYDPQTLKASWSGLDNFKQFINNFFNSSVMKGAFKNSLTAYLLSVVLTAVIPIFFSYYVYKKLPGSAVFKVVLFLPSIISGIITVTVYKYIADRIIPELWLKLFDKQITGLLSDPNKTFATILFYHIWMALGGGLLIQLGSMNSVDKSVTEASKLDGVGFFGELWHVVLPKCYQVISIGFILGVVSIFTNDLGMYAFYGTSADSRLYTIGYYFTVMTLDSSIDGYPYLAAWGLTATAIALPFTFLFRHLIYKYGPQEE